MLTIRHKPTTQHEPDLSASNKILADIRADLRALRSVSSIQARRYALLKKAERIAHRAKLSDSAASLSEAVEANYARLRALKGDPLPLETDDGNDLFEVIEAATE